MEIFLTRTAIAQETMWSLNTSQKHSLIPVINVKWFLQLRAIFLFTDQENTNKTELDNIEINLLNLKLFLFNF